MKDMDVLDFARKISMLSTNTPLSIEYDKAHGQKTGDIWWTCQREHLTVWCLHYPTGGTKEFKHKPSNSSKTMYNLFGRPETLLWLTEALGEKKEIIQPGFGHSAYGSNRSAMLWCQYKGENFKCSGRTGCRTVSA